VEKLLLTLSDQDSDTGLESSTISLDYVQKLLDAFASAHVVSHRVPLVPLGEVPPMQRPYSQAETAPPVALVEPLSERELDVLRMLLTDLSSTEIAEELYISKNTVRSHIGHIYDKLGVHSREEAVQQARALGLL
jgi:LuxR family maltose regulon positive regulatory protein